jgi:hypothetical protein
MNSSKPSFPEWSESNMAIMLRQMSLLKPSIANSVINATHTRALFKEQGHVVSPVYGIYGYYEFLRQEIITIFGKKDYHHQGFHFSI